MAAKAYRPAASPVTPGQMHRVSGEKFPSDSPGSDRHSHPVHYPPTTRLSSLKYVPGSNRRWQQTCCRLPERPLLGRHLQELSLRSWPVLYFGLLGHFQGAIDLNAEITNRTLQLRVSQQQLNGSQVLGSALIQGRLRSHAMPPPWQTSLTRGLTRSQARSLLSMARLNSASSRRRPASCTRLPYKLSTCSRVREWSLRSTCVSWLAPVVMEPASLRRVEGSLTEPDLPVAGVCFWDGKLRIVDGLVCRHRRKRKSGLFVSSVAHRRCTRKGGMPSLT
jgi:hypothetical protein